MHPQFGTCSLGHCKGMAAIFPWRPLYQKKRGNGTNLPIARETRITKELLSGPTQSRLVALLLLSHLPIPSPLIARHSHRAKKMRLCLMPSNLIALLPSVHLLSHPHLHLWTDRAPPYHRLCLPQHRCWRRWHPIEYTHRETRFHMNPRHRLAELSQQCLGRTIRTSLLHHTSRLCLRIMQQSLIFCRIIKFLLLHHTGRLHPTNIPL